MKALAAAALVGTLGLGSGAYASDADGTETSEVAASTHRLTYAEIPRGTKIGLGLGLGGTAGLAAGVILNGATMAFRLDQGINARDSFGVIFLFSTLGHLSGIALTAAGAGVGTAGSFKGFSSLRSEGYAVPRGVWALPIAGVGLSAAGMVTMIFASLAYTPIIGASGAAVGLAGVGAMVGSLAVTRRVLKKGPTLARLDTPPRMELAVSPVSVGVRWR